MAPLLRAATLPANSTAKVDQSAAALVRAATTAIGQPAVNTAQAAVTQQQEGESDPTQPLQPAAAVPFTKSATMGHFQTHADPAPIISKSALILFILMFLKYFWHERKASQNYW